MIGTCLSHYELLEVVGTGGIGVVYRARDKHLDRDVAVKVLSEGALADETVRKRFRREALSLSKLNHPNINTVHDFDSQGDIDFLVVEFVSGETLTKRIARGPLPVTELLPFAIQIAEALAVAHEQGVIHRDLKPGNIMVTERGQAKVLDFGLARRIAPPDDLAVTTDSIQSAPLSVSGQLLGTFPYMSPEQLLGQKLDARTDLWSTGVILFEMATGARPFKASSSVGLMHAILSNSVTFPAGTMSSVPKDLQAVILRCLEKDSARRYGSAHELLSDLRAVLAGRRPAASRSPRTRRLLPAAWVGVALVAVAVGALFLPRIFAPGPAIHSLAVLPLANLSGDPDQEFLADGLTDELISAFSRIGGIRVISRGSVIRFKNSKQPIAEIARKLNADAVLEGTIRRADSTVTVTVMLVRAATNDTLWSENYERPFRKQTRLGSEVATEVARQVRVNLTPPEQARFNQARAAVRPEAYEAYLRGRHYWNQFTVDGFRKAVEQFDHAIEIQPDYGAAYAGLAHAYAGLSTFAIEPKEAMPRVRAAADRAITFDPDLSEGYAARAMVEAFYDWNWNAAEADFKRAIALAPGDAPARLDYGYMLVVTGRFKEATEQLARAHELDPLSSFIASVQLWPLYEGRRYDEAIRAAQEVISVDSTAWNAHQVLGQAYFQKGEFAKSFEAGARAGVQRGLDTTNFFGEYYAAVGAPSITRQKLARLLKEGKEPWMIASLYAALGEKEQALNWLEKEIDRRNEAIVFLKVDPAWDTFRSEPRFHALLRRMNLER